MVSFELAILIRNYFFKWVVAAKKGQRNGGHQQEEYEERDGGIPWLHTCILRAGPVAGSCVPVGSAAGVGRGLLPLAAGWEGAVSCCRSETGPEQPCQQTCGKGQVTDCSDVAPQLPMFRGSQDDNDDDFALADNPITPASAVFPLAKTPQCEHISPGMLVPINR